MNYTVRNLTLHGDIAIPPEGPAKDGTIAILVYRSLVRKGDLEPTGDAHLSKGALDENGPVIPAGNYLFAQGPSAEAAFALGESGITEAERDWRNAAEAVWLESLWQEAEFKTDRIYIRILSEDSKTVFQIFREINKGV